MGQTPPDDDAKARWAEAIRKGHVTPVKRPRGPLPPGRQPPVMTLEEILADLDEARADRWPLDEPDAKPESK